MANEFQMPNEEAIDRANAWVARFAPLVMGEPPLDDAGLRERLQQVEQLRQEAPEVAAGLRRVIAGADPALQHTLDQAIGQLDSVEEELRRRIARVAPGDPEGLVDLNAVQERLAERAARTELGLPQPLSGEPLTLKTQPGSMAAASGIGLMGIGMGAFVVFHATLMIGGMFRAFGPIALLLLGFYAIFGAAVVAMLKTAAKLASSETIRLDGHRLTVRRELFGRVGENEFVLARGTRAIEATQAVQRSVNSITVQNGATNRYVSLTDAEGREVQIAFGSPPALQEMTTRQINAYLERAEKLVD